MTLAAEILNRPPTQRRLLALLLALVLAAAMWNVVVLPVAWIVASQDEWRGEVVAELARDKGRAALEADVRRQLSELTSAPIWSRFYQAAEGGDARAMIQRDVTSLCATAGALVQAIVPLPATEERGLTRHGARITATVTADQMKVLIAAIRNHPKYLRVEHLTVSAPQIQSADQNPPLVVTMEIFGYSHAATGRGKA